MSCAANINSSLGNPSSQGIPNTITRKLCAKMELKRTESLKACLSWYGVMDDTFDYQHRMKIIKTLESLFKEWLVEMCDSMNLPKRVRDNVGGKVVPYGSFHLGAYSKDADLNILCVGPRFLQRKDFFTSFFEKLEAQEEVQDIQVTGEALEMTYEGIEVDLVFACLKRRSVPENMDLLDDQLLNEMDLQCVMSLNGYRVSEEILKIVPNKENFRLALRAIRFWAKRRDISFFNLGFFSSVTWAILMARICHVFPTATASILVIQFFKLMCQWTNDPYPVLLRPGVSESFRGITFWDPQINPGVVNIITPTCPQLNTTFNVTLAAFAIIKEELERGSVIAMNIWIRQATWSNLFEIPNFSGEYKQQAPVETQGPTVTKIQTAMKRKDCSDSEMPAKRIKTDTESSKNPQSEQASAPTTPFKVPRAPKRQRSPSAETTSKRPRLSVEAGPGTRVTSRRPVENRMPEKTFDAYQSLTAKLGVAPPCPATPVLVVKRGITFQLLREPAMVTSSSAAPLPQEDGLWMFLLDRDDPEENVEKRQQDLA